MQYLEIEKEEWNKALKRLLLSYSVFATVKNDFGIDYEPITPLNINEISYNKPKPATSLKSFFLPIKENVTSEIRLHRPVVLIGVPNCDIAGLSLLDQIYLDKDFTDHYYKHRRDKTLLISTDCFGIQDHCHCTSYGIKPYSDSGADLAIISRNDLIVLRVITGRGREFLTQFAQMKKMDDNSILSYIKAEHENTEEMLVESNKGLPDYITTGRLLMKSDKQIWIRYSSDCVSCGACAAICPTCSCFLLIDKPGFEKVKQLDTCQYPGFERVAGGEDGLFEKHQRFRNRYMCKYVWKPEKFDAIACTGCGRCIEACIGGINRNRLFLELTT